MATDSTAGVEEIRITDAARALGRAKSTIQGHIQRGNLRRTRDGFIRLDDVRALADRHKHMDGSRHDTDFETRLKEINMDMETRLMRLSRAFGLYAKVQTEKTDRLVNMVRLLVKNVQAAEERGQRLENDLRELKRRHGINT